VGDFRKDTLDVLYFRIMMVRPSISTRIPMPKARTKSRKPKSRRRISAGWSIPGAAEEAGVSYKTMLEAIRRGQVKVIPFGGLAWVPNSEVKRLKEVFAE
jgi:hypothetical protein